MIFIFKYECMGVKPKQAWHVFWLFFKIGLRPAISFERSRQELSIDVADVSVGLCWKITKIRTTPVLVSYPNSSIPQSGGIVFTVT